VEVDRLRLLLSRLRDAFPMEAQPGGGSYKVGRGRANTLVRYNLASRFRCKR
jgi:hypothetical protein